MQQNITPIKQGSESNPFILNVSRATVIFGNYWSENPPVLYVKSGDYVKVHTLIVSNPMRLQAAGIAFDKIEKELQEVQVIQDRGPGRHILTGPIYIEEAEHGDVLEVRIIKIDLAIPYGYNAIGHNGFLSDEIFEKNMKIIPLDKKRMIARFSENVEIPLHPFFGSMGVAPSKEVGRWNSTLPWIHGGNMDNKELVAGTSLFLPVFTEGALFQIGDGHAAQGNGEINMTAIETSLKGTLQFIVHKGRYLSMPRAETPAHIITMGFDKDVNAALHMAVHEMIKYLTEEENMTKIDAYKLSSIAVDINITQLVNINVGVHAMLPKNIFLYK